MNEVWKPIPYPFSKYEVSNYGDVVSPRVTTLARLLDSAGGNPTVILTNRDDAEGINSAVSVRHLVALAFIDGYDGSQGLRHIDGNSNNCRLDNLRMYDKSIEHENPNYPNKQELEELILKGYSAEAIRKKYSMNEFGVGNLITQYNLTYLLHEKYEGETSRYVQGYLRSIDGTNLTLYCQSVGIPPSQLRNNLKRCGFPNSRKLLIQLINYADSKGQKEDFIKGHLNINRVVLLDGEVKKQFSLNPFYYITNYGRVISHIGFTKEKIMECDTARDRQPQVTLSGYCKMKYDVAYLVALEFVPNPNPAKLTKVIPLDGNFKNLNSNNLVWVDKITYNKLRLKMRGV